MRVVNGRSYLASEHKEVTFVCRSHFRVSLQKGIRQRDEIVLGETFQKRMMRPFSLVATT
jgi:hypothetical protein